MFWLGGGVHTPLIPATWKRCQSRCRRHSDNPEKYLSGQVITKALNTQSKAAWEKCKGIQRMPIQSIQLKL